MAQKKTNKTHYSPKGKFIYPKLTKPDTKFDPEGVYSVRVAIPAEDAAPMVEMIDDAIEKKYQEALEEAGTPAKRKKVKKADAPYQPEEDDDGNETGNIVFNFKLKAVGRNTKTGETWKNVVKLYDAKNREIPPAKRGALKIGGGTVGCIAYQLNPFYTAQVGAGVSLRLLAAQIVELVEFGGGFAFGSEDGGFSSDDLDDDDEGFGSKSTDEDDEDESEEDASDDGDEDEDF